MSSLLQSIVQAASSTSISPFPAPNSGSFNTNRGSSFGSVGTPYDPGGGIVTVGSMWDGLQRKTYNGVWSNNGGNDNPSLFNGSPDEIIYSDVYVSFGSQSASAIDYAMEWKGYIQAPGNNAYYNFYLESDDYAMVWIGDAALDPDNNTPLITTNNAGALNTNSIQMTSGLYYPIRLRFQERSGGEYCQLYMSVEGGTLLSMNNWYTANNHEFGYN